MGFMDTVKGWFNIGGVKVKLVEAPTKISKTGNELEGKVEMTAKSDKHALKLVYKLIEEHTKGRGDDQETTETILGETVVGEEFDIKAGESKVIDFKVAYSMPERLRDKGGLLGGAAKLGAFAGGEKLDYQIVAVCDVQGTAVDPKAKQKVVLTD